MCNLGKHTSWTVLTLCFFYSACYGLRFQGCSGHYWRVLFHRGNNKPGLIEATLCVSVRIGSIYFSHLLWCVDDIIHIASGEASCSHSKYLKYFWEPSSLLLLPPPVVWSSSTLTAPEPSTSLSRCCLYNSATFLTALSFCWALLTVHPH